MAADTALPDRCVSGIPALVSIGMIASYQHLHLCSRQGSKRIAHGELPHDSVLLVTPDGNSVYARLPALSLPALEGGDGRALRPDRGGTSWLLCPLRPIELSHKRVDDYSQ